MEFRLLRKNRKKQHGCGLILSPKIKLFEICMEFWNFAFYEKIEKGNMVTNILWQNSAPKQ